MTTAVPWTRLHGWWPHRHPLKQKRDMLGVGGARHVGDAPSSGNMPYKSGLP